MCARPLPSLALGVFSVRSVCTRRRLARRWRRGGAACPPACGGSCGRAARGGAALGAVIAATETAVGGAGVESERLLPRRKTRPKGRKRAGLGLTSSTILGLGSLGGAHPESWSIRLPRDHYTWLSLAARGAPTGNTFRPSAQVRHPAQLRLGVRRAASPRPRPSPQRHNGWYSPSHCGVASPSQLHHGGGADGAGGGGNTHRSLSPNRLLFKPAFWATSSNQHQ